ncbi:MAG: hypothetical protein AAGI24_12565 [Pseudomonadota bacterium]
MDREGLEVTDAPQLDKTERFNPHTGEIYGVVPPGVDVSWNYNVGKAWMAPDRVFGERIMALPPRLRRDLLEQIQARAVDGDPAFEQLADQAVMSAAAGKDATGNIRTVGWLQYTVVEQLAVRGAMPGNAAVLVRDRELIPMLKLLDDDFGLDSNFVRRLPATLRDSDAVVWDADDAVLQYLTRLNDQQWIDVSIAPSLADDATVNALPVVLRSNVILGGRIIADTDLDRDRYQVLQGFL